MADYEEMTNDELREELEKRDLKVSGNKDELVARLELDDEENGDSPDATPEPQEPEATADKDVVEAGGDADAEAVAEANADVNTVVDRGSFMGDEAKGNFMSAGNVSRKTEAPNVDLSGSEDAESDEPVQLGASSAVQAPTSRGTVFTGPEVRGRQVPEGGDDLEPITRSTASYGGLPPQSQPDNLSPEVSGYQILPDGRRQAINIQD